MRGILLYLAMDSRRIPPSLSRRRGRCKARGLRSTSRPGLGQPPEEDLDLLLGLKVPGARRHLQADRVRGGRVGRTARPLEGAAEAARGGRVVGLAPDRLGLLR